jgi:glutathione S-transferase
MSARLYVVPASHPCFAVSKALDLKGISYETTNLLPVFHKVHQRLRFGSPGSVPGLRFEDGEKLLGSRAILRELDRRVPSPALVTGGEKAEEAETWGDEVLQSLVRRIVWQALSRDTNAQLSYLAGLKLTPPVPAFMAKLSGGMVGWAERKINASTDSAARADLASLPGHLDRIDAWLAEGVLGGESPSAADLQIASSLRLLLTLDDVVPMFEGRPSADYARRVFPDYPGHTPAGALPQEWLPKG